MVFKQASRLLGLFNLSPALGSRKKQKRVGRGQASGYGRTAGRGNNGQKSRSGYSKPTPDFEGGQTSIIKRFPKLGFHNINTRTWAPVNIDRIQHWIDIGRLACSDARPISSRDLLLSGCIHDIHDGVKLLASGSERLHSKLHIIAERASQSAIKAVEKAGGSVVCVYRTRQSLRDCISSDEMRRTSAFPTRKKDILWYTRWKNRGYLAPHVVETNPRLREVSASLVHIKDEAFKYKGGRAP